MTLITRQFAVYRFLRFRWAHRGDAQAWASPHTFQSEEKKAKHGYDKIYERDVSRR